MRHVEAERNPNSLRRKERSHRRLDPRKTNGEQATSTWKTTASSAQCANAALIRGDTPTTEIRILDSGDAAFPDGYDIIARSGDCGPDLTGFKFAGTIAINMSGMPLSFRGGPICRSLGRAAMLREFRRSLR